jgi:hypothetical protein
MSGSALAAGRPSLIVDGSDQCRCSACRLSRLVTELRSGARTHTWRRVGVCRLAVRGRPTRSRARALSATPRAAGQAHSGDAEDHEGGIRRPGSPTRSVVPRAPPGRGRRRQSRSGRRPPAAAAGPGPQPGQAERSSSRASPAPCTGLPAANKKRCRNLVRPRPDRDGSERRRGRRRDGQREDRAALVPPNAKQVL